MGTPGPQPQVANDSGLHPMWHCAHKTKIKGPPLHLCPSPPGELVFKARHDILPSIYSSSTSYTSSAACVPLPPPCVCVAPCSISRRLARFTRSDGRRSATRTMCVVPAAGQRGGVRNRKGVPAAQCAEASSHTQTHTHTHAHTHSARRSAEGHRRRTCDGAGAWRIVRCALRQAVPDGLVLIDVPKLVLHRML